VKPARGTPAVGASVPFAAAHLPNIVMLNYLLCWRPQATCKARQQELCESCASASCAAATHCIRNAPTSSQSELRTVTARMRPGRQCGIRAVYGSAYGMACGAWASPSCLHAGCFACKVLIACVYLRCWRYIRCACVCRKYSSTRACGLRRRRRPPGLRNLVVFKPLLTCHNMTCMFQTACDACLANVAQFACAQLPQKEAGGRSTAPANEQVHLITQSLYTYSKTK
jgi:hypothetical protein